MNSAKNKGSLKKIIDNNVNRKVQILPILTKKIEIKMSERSSITKNGNVT